MAEEKDLEFEEEELGSEEALKKLREKLKLAQAERQEYLEASQRLRADYVNLKRESETARLELTKFANEGLLLETISVLDSFEQAFSHQESWAGVPEVWRQGVEQIHDKLGAVLKKHGIEVLDPVGQEFNPSEAQAVGTIDTEKDEDDNMVLEVVQKGYRLHGKVIRPASVRVGHKI